MLIIHEKPKRRKKKRQTLITRSLHNTHTAPIRIRSFRTIWTNWLETENKFHFHAIFSLFLCSLTHDSFSIYSYLFYCVCASFVGRMWDCIGPVFVISSYLKTILGFSAYTQYGYKYTFKLIWICIKISWPAAAAACCCRYFSLDCVIWVYCFACVVVMLLLFSVCCCLLACLLTVAAIFVADVVVVVGVCGAAVR